MARSSSLKAFRKRGESAVFVFCDPLLNQTSLVISLITVPSTLNRFAEC